MTVNIKTILAELIAAGIIDKTETSCQRLGGGVSSDIYLIEQSGKRMVVKQALPKLRVKDLWQVDVGRNRTEQHFIRLVSTFLPEAMPRILYCDEKQNYFVMEHLGGYLNWKSMLLSGNVSTEAAHDAGRIMGSLHSRTWGDKTLAKRFDTSTNFYALRIEPYLLTTALKHPALARELQVEARRLRQCRVCLIHGDFSPKNIMLSRGKMILLDCEVACYGDPAFDLAFLFNHFLLKAMLHRGRHKPFVQLVPSAWESYRECFDALAPDIEKRTVRLLVLLMLARIDGKSPVEYITDEAERRMIRSFVYTSLSQKISTLNAICTLCEQCLDSKHEN